MKEPIPFAGYVEVDEDEKKYCSSCMNYKSFEKGKIVQTANRKIKRFKCFECLERASVQKYANRKKLLERT
jgi:hypothetical protein